MEFESLSGKPPVSATEFKESLITNRQQQPLFTHKPLTDDEGQPSSVILFPKFFIFTRSGSKSLFPFGCFIGAEYTKREEEGDYKIELNFLLPIMATGCCGGTKDPPKRRLHTFIFFAREERLARNLCSRCIALMQGKVPKYEYKEMPVLEKYKVVINPQSCNGRAIRVWRTAERIFEKASVELDVTRTEAAGHGKEIG